MDMQFARKFTRRWEKFFGQAELPIAFYYTNNPEGAELEQPPRGHQCLIGSLNQVRKGKSLAFHHDGLGCGGGKRYLGFTRDLAADFEYFLSCGIPGKLEGERYKKSPQIVAEMMKTAPHFTAPAKYIVFKPWEKLDCADQPAVVIFFAKPDVLSGLYTLAGFDEARLDGVYAPFSAGCGSIVLYPYLERSAPKPRAVLGMFDVSARPYVPAGTLTFAIPMEKFVSMVDNMEESFLITPSWEKVHKRI